jgi:hypothetical protein
MSGLTGVWRTTSCMIQVSMLFQGSGFQGSSSQGPEHKTSVMLCISRLPPARCTNS